MKPAQEVFQSAGLSETGGNVLIPGVVLLGLDSHYVTPGRIEIGPSAKIDSTGGRAFCLDHLPFVKSMRIGADSFVPKDEIADIEYYVEDAIRAKRENKKQPGRWFSKLQPFFDRKFGPGWLENYNGFWE